MKFTNFHSTLWWSREQRFLPTELFFGLSSEVPLKFQVPLKFKGTKQDNLKQLSGSAVFHAFCKLYFKRSWSLSTRFMGPWATNRFGLWTDLLVQFTVWTTNDKPNHVFLVHGHSYFQLLKMLMPWGQVGNSQARHLWAPCDDDLETKGVILREAVIQVT